MAIELTPLHPTLNPMAEIICPKVTGVITDTPQELLTDEKRGRRQI
jgi:hypothetical protein